MLTPSDLVTKALLDHLALPLIEPGLSGFYATRSGLIVRARPPAYKTKVDVASPRRYRKGAKAHGWLHILKPRFHHRTTHPYINIRVDGKHKSFLLPRLVAGAHLGPAPEGCRLVAHEDGIPTHCAASNLRWDDDAGNAADRVWHKRNGYGRPRSRLEDYYKAKAQEQQLPEAQLPEYIPDAELGF